MYDLALHFRVPRMKAAAQLYRALDQLAAFRTLPMARFSAIRDAVYTPGLPKR